LVTAKAVKASYKQLKTQASTEADPKSMDVVHGLVELQERLLAECKALCSQCQRDLAVEEEEVARLRRLHLSAPSSPSSSSAEAVVSLGTPRSPAGGDGGHNTRPSSATSALQGVRRLLAGSLAPGPKSAMRSFVAKLRVAQRLAPILATRCKGGSDEVLQVVDAFVATFGRAVELLVAMRLVSVMEAPFAAEEEAGAWEELSRRLGGGPCLRESVYQNSALLMDAARVAAGDLEVAYDQFHSELGRPNTKHLHKEFAVQVEKASAASTVANTPVATPLVTPTAAAGLFTPPVRTMPSSVVVRYVGTTTSHVPLPKPVAVAQVRHAHSHMPPPSQLHGHSHSHMPGLAAAPPPLSSSTWSLPNLHASQAQSRTTSRCPSRSLTPAHSVASLGSVSVRSVSRARSPTPYHQPIGTLLTSRTRSPTPVHRTVAVVHSRPRSPTPVHPSSVVLPSRTRSPSEPLCAPAGQSGIRWISTPVSSVQVPPPRTASHASPKSQQMRSVLAHPYA